MKIGNLKCPNCAGTLLMADDGIQKVCPYCETIFAIEDILQEQVQEHVQESMQPAVSQDSVQIIKDPTEIVRNICATSGFDSMYGVVGYSLLNSSKFQKAKLHFGIADCEDAYFLFDSTVLGGYRKGFAVCTNGFYYCASDSKAYVIYWAEFKKTVIQKRSRSIGVGSVEFIAGNDDNKIFEILTEIQNSL